MNTDGCLQFNAGHMTPCFEKVGQAVPCNGDVCVAQIAVTERLANIVQEQSELAEMARVALATGCSSALEAVREVAVDNALHEVCPISFLVNGPEWQAREADYYAQVFPLIW
jgi:hypothetical protein